MRGGGDVRSTGRLRQLLKESVAGGILGHVAAIELNGAARLQRRADRGELTLVLPDGGGIEFRAAQLEQAVGTVRYDVDGGEVLDVVAGQIIGDLSHAIQRGVQQNDSHARRDAAGEYLRVGHIALDEDDLPRRRAGLRHLVSRRHLSANGRRVEQAERHDRRVSA